MHNEKTIPFFGELNESQDQAFKSEAKAPGRDADTFAPGLDQKSRGISQTQGYAGG